MTFVADSQKLAHKVRNSGWYSIKIVLINARIVEQLVEEEAERLSQSLYVFNHAFKFDGH